MSGTNIDPTTYPQTQSMLPQDAILLGRPVAGAPSALLGITVADLAASVAALVGTVQGQPGAAGAAGPAGAQGLPGVPGLNSSISDLPLGTAITPVNYVGVSVNGNDQKVSVNALFGSLANQPTGFLGLDAQGNPTQPGMAATFLVTQNPSTISENLTIPAGNNAVWAGPLTISAGVTIAGNVTII
jgi:hypothetical protein